MTPRKGKVSQVRSGRRFDGQAAARRRESTCSRGALCRVAVEDVPAGFVNPDAKLPAGVRKFGTNTADLEALAAWLKDCA